jgi:hypothetical protein
VKALKSIIAILLTVAFLNVIVGKVVHEIFEHEHTEHTCDVKDLTHFHEFEYAHSDIICNFNISSTDPFAIQHAFQVHLDFYQSQVNIIYLWLVKNLFYDLSLLRGPPLK